VVDPAVSPSQVSSLTLSNFADFEQCGHIMDKMDLINAQMPYAEVASSSLCLKQKEVVDFFKGAEGAYSSVG
jgi:hypothetical protein